MIQLSTLPLGLVLLLGLLALLLHALLYALKKYGLPLVKSRRQRQRLEALLLRVGVALWLGWSVFAFYRLLLASPVVAGSTTILLIVLGWPWWRDFYPGLLLRLEGDLRPGDYLNYEGRAYKIMQLRGRSAKLAGEDGGLLVLPYHLIQAPAIQRSVEKTALSLFSFEVTLEGPNAQQRLEQWLAASPWTAPAYPATVAPLGPDTYRITAYAPDTDIQERQEAYIRQQTDG
jgi:hypothetical protein